MMADVTACVISSGRCAVVVVVSYAGSSAPSPPLASVIDNVALSGCKGVVAYDFTHSLHQRRPSRTFARERGGSAAASLRVLLYLGGGGRGRR